MSKLTILVKSDNFGGDSLGFEDVGFCVKLRVVGQLISGCESSDLVVLLNFGWVVWMIYLI